MKSHFFLVSAFIFLLLKPYSQQAQQITFNQVFPPERPFRFINGVTQDTLGYMWFSSYGIGLIRYDGYQVTLFRNDPGDSNSLATNNVVCVFADHNGMIWVGTQSGLDRLDPRTGIFAHFRHKKKDLSSLSNDVVLAILEDHNGTLWIGTENGLNRMDMKTETFTRYQQNPNDATTLSCNRVQVLYEDHQGTLWVGTADPQRFFDSDEKGGLNKLDRKTGKFTRYLHDPKDSLTLINDRIGAILEDSRGVFWVSTAGDGLHTMNRERGTFQRCTYDPSHPEKLSGPPPEKPVDLDLNNFFVTEDSSGAIWIASSKRWVTRYDPKTKKIHHFDSFNGDVRAARAVTEAFSSREGVLWFTTWRGSIFRIDPFEVSIPHVFTGNSVHAVHEDFSGALWLGTRGEGLMQTDRNKSSIKRFTDLPSPYGLSDSFITAIYEEGDSTLWIGSGNNGLSHYNRKTKIFTRYVNDPKNKTSLTKGFVTAIAEDKPGSLWIATTKGLDRFDIKNGVFTHYWNNPKDNTSLGGNNVSSLLKDHSGNLWAGNGSGMLNLFDSQTGKFKHFSCGGGINSITEDAENIIWLGTSQGLYKSNPAVDTFLLFTDPEIGLTATTIIACILEDDKKNLWVSSSAGILRFSHKRDEITVYSGNQGVDASSLTHAWGHNMQGTKGKRGELFFGDTTGYYAFFPDQLKRNVTPPQIVITDFRLADNQPVKPGKGSPLNVPIIYTNEIHLKYNQNVFSFDFIGIHYSSPEDTRILYLMENLDNTWRRASRERKAFYYNVPPGRYIFHVKAANRDGVWANKSILIIIAPPWWHTSWAYILFSISFLIALWSFIKWREKTLRNEKIVLEKKVAIRTLELQKEKDKVETTLAELKVAQEQLIEAEKRAAIEKSRQAVLNERFRISRELHDEVGATLSSISIFSQAAIQKNDSGDISNSKNILEKIGETSREVMGELNDTVWLINPLNDNLHTIIQRISNYALPLCRTKNICLEIKNDLVENPALDIEKRKAVYLIMKEAVNNTLKYAFAENLVIQFEKKCDILHISIRDDGKGFEKNNSFAGNGLNNMKQRITDIKGKIEINSAPQKGTEIILQVPLTNIGD
jgi:ligand-binding sensor domain-containing protein/signal transduction histidine kinase